jgi:hypothetical protein
VWVIAVLAKAARAGDGDISFFQITGTTRPWAVSRKITEKPFSGVFWIRPLVGVFGRPSRVKASRYKLLQTKINGTYEEMPLAA